MAWHADACNLQPATCNLQPATCNLQPVPRQCRRIRATERKRDAQEQVHSEQIIGFIKQADAGMSVAD